MRKWKARKLSKIMRDAAQIVPDETPVAVPAPDPEIEAQRKAALQTELAQAIIDDDQKRVLLALRRGADMRTADKKSGYKPVFLAISEHNREMVSFLLAQGADCGETDNNGYAPLHAAIEEKQFDIAFDLLDRGADVQARGGGGEMLPLQILALQRLEDCEEDDAAALASRLIGAGAGVDAAERSSSPALSYAVEQGSLKMVNILLEAGARPVLSFQVYSLLRQVVQERPQAVDILSRLLEAGLETPVVAKHLESLSGREDDPIVTESIVQFIPLVQKELDAGDSPALGRACVAAMETLSAKWRQQERDWRFADVVRLDTVEDAARAVVEGASIEALDIEGWTPLIRTTVYDRPDMVFFLLKIGASFEAQDKQGHTALFRAADKDKWDIAQILIEGGARIDDDIKANVAPDKLKRLEDIFRDSIDRDVDAIRNGVSRRIRLRPFTPGGGP